MHTNKLAAIPPSFSLTLSCRETFLVSLLLSLICGWGFAMSWCSALELAGRSCRLGISGREDSLGGKDGDAQLHSSGPVALILSQLLHMMLWHSHGILNIPVGKPQAWGALRWLHVVMLDFGSISRRHIQLDDWHSSSKVKICVNGFKQWKDFC